jgi:hypothetical protein
VSDFGFQIKRPRPRKPQDTLLVIQGVPLTVSGFRFGFSGCSRQPETLASGCKIEGLNLGVGLGFRVSGFGFRVLPGLGSGSGLGFRVEERKWNAHGFRVWGLGCERRSL